MASHPLFIIPDYFLHFPNEHSYGYLRFEGNGKILISLKIQKKVWYYEKWVGRHASFPPRRSIKQAHRKKFIEAIKGFDRPAKECPCFDQKVLKFLVFRGHLQYPLKSIGPVTVKSPKETEMKTNLSFLIFFFINGTVSNANVGGKWKKYQYFTFFSLFSFHFEVLQM